MLLCDKFAFHDLFLQPQTIGVSTVNDALSRHLWDWKLGWLHFLVMVDPHFCLNSNSSRVFPQLPKITKAIQVYPVILAISPFKECFLTRHQPEVDVFWTLSTPRIWVINLRNFEGHNLTFLILSCRRGALLVFPNWCERTDRQWIGGSKWYSRNMQKRCLEWLLVSPCWTFNLEVGDFEIKTKFPDLLQKSPNPAGWATRNTLDDWHSGLCHCIFRYQTFMEVS